MKVTAVFDIGKTNKKLLLFNDSFKVVYQHEEKFPTTKDEDGFECDDIDLITSWIKESLEKIVRKDEFDLVSVNFSTYGASLVFIDKNGERLTPVYNYLKEVSPLIKERLFDEYGGRNEFCRKTASPDLGLLLNSGIQILWIKKEKPEVYQKTDAILHFPQYLSFILTKKIVSEPTSIGCHTFMWDFDEMKYHRWLSDEGIYLPQPLTNDVVFPAVISGKTIKVGTGIHDSSASLVPYLKGSDKKFILVSTGTWCINMNPFNDEPLTAEQLEQDCLCFLSPDKQQVKSSRLFMGHFHEVWAEKLSQHFNVATDNFKHMRKDDRLLARLFEKYPEPVFFPDGKESFEDGLKSVDLSMFANYDEAYSKLIIDLTDLWHRSVLLVIPEKDETENIYISGGFARNEIFVSLVKRHFPDKKVLTSEIDNSSALGAALVIAGTITDKEISGMDLGLANE